MIIFLQVGDWVEHYRTGEKYEVFKNTRKDKEIYPLKPGELRLSFTTTGRVFVDDKNPMFIKCEPPRKKVKKKVTTVVYQVGHVTYSRSAVEAFPQIPSLNYTELARFENEFEVEE